MMSLRPTRTVLIGILSTLLIAQAATAAQGKGGKGKDAAVGIDAIVLTNPINPGGEVRAEIAGGGFLSGAFLQVTLNGVSLAIDEASEDMIVTHIPRNTPDGDHDVTVTTDLDNKNSATQTISLGGSMIVSCISWFESGPADEHIHTEVHVEDEYGDPVIGATVVWTAENDSIGLYQTNASVTHDNDGHAAGENCVNQVSGSGVTDWFCCIGAGKWDGETPPGKRACNPGTYTASILSVSAPAFTNMVWDEDVSELEASFELVDPKFP